MLFKISREKNKADRQECQNHGFPLEALPFDDHNRSTDQPCQGDKEENV